MPKISRRKVPNLINLPHDRKQKEPAYPRFFSKIQNSLKLLQQPLERRTSVASQKQNLNRKKYSSKHLQKLSKPRQTHLSLPHGRQASSKANQKAQNRGGKSFSLIPIVNHHALTSREQNKTSLSKKSRVIHRASHSLHMATPTPEVQTINGTALDCMNFDQIFQRKNNMETLPFLQSLKVELYDEVSSSEKSSENSLGEDSMFQNTELLKQNGEENGGKDDWSKKKRKLQQLSNKIIYGQSKYPRSSNAFTQLTVKKRLLKQEKKKVQREKQYDFFDRKLMEKIKMYKPKRVPLQYRIQWK